MTDPVREGKRLYREGRLRGAWAAGEVLARLEALEAFRDSLPARRKRMWLLLVGSIVVAVAVAILRTSFSNCAGAGTPEVICFSVLLACTTAFAAAVVMLIRLGAGRYDGDAAAVLGPLVRCLGPDLAPGSRFRVNAGLKSPTASDLLRRTGEKYATPTYPRCVDRFFQRDILKLECRLRDGTRLQAGMSEQTVETVLSKKNARGKWKKKSKCRRRIRIRARLLLDHGRCRLTGDLRLPGGTKVRVRRHPRGALLLLSLRKKMAGSEPLDARPLLALLSGAYGAVTTVRRNEPISPGGVQ